MKLPATGTDANYQDSGFCAYCLMTLESKQPGGTDVRHKSNKVPYGECPQAVKAEADKGKRRL